MVFFDNGTFCKGTLQVAPGTPFGGEFGFVDGDRRHRLVQLHDSEGTLSGLVLIREFRAGSGAVERPPLQPAALLGEWQGQASTINADWPEPEVAAAALQVQAGAAGELSLQITLGTRREPAEGRLLLLPDGAFISRR